MAMKLIKKSADYKIFIRGDDRYAVQDSNGRSVNGEEKVRILVEEELIKIAVPSAPAVADEVEAVAEEAAEQNESEENAPEAPEAPEAEEAPVEEDAPVTQDAEEEGK